MRYEYIKIKFPNMHWTTCNLISSSHFTFVLVCWFFIYLRELSKRLFAVSYELYSFLGGCFTMAVGLVDSVLTGGEKSRFDNEMTVKKMNLKSKTLSKS